MVFECEGNLGPIINISDDYILYIQRSNNIDRIKKLDLKSGDVKEVYYFGTDRYKEAFFDDNNESFFAYNDVEIWYFNVSEDEEVYLTYTVLSDGSVFGNVKDIPEGYYAKQYTYYGYYNKENRLHFYKDTEDGEEILTFHNQDSLELITNKGNSTAETATLEDTLYVIDSIRTEFLSEWDKGKLSMVKRGNDGYSSWNKETFYEDESNRIIGYNPDCEIVYLFSFENKSIIMKNIEDDSETIIEELEDADKIEFEWEESKLYWRYTNDEVETFGGCYDFGE